MAEIIKAGDSGSLGDIDITQGDIRDQFDQLVDAVRQLGGNANVGNDPLSAPYVLYVDPNIGSDKFVSGDYKTVPNTSYEDKMRRISMQRLECGYTPSRPFRTINRAILEAGIITSRSYLTLGSVCGDLVSIVLAQGVTTVLNDAGDATTPAWTDDKEPTNAELIAFNPAGVGGLILPRGCSLISLDLRKTVIRPNAVPAPADEEVDYSNRRAIFKMSGGGYYYGFTVFDQVNATTSHHLLDVFQYASEAELDEFYAKIRSSFSAIADLNDAFAVTRNTEYQTVGPAPVNPTTATDTVQGSSPYVYNVSIRSNYGLCGLFANGAVWDGFKSTVIAQYTAISLQKDLSSWQRYVAGNWVAIPDYDTYINTDPNNLRPNPVRRSFHIRAVNNAVIQEVSVFAIGQAIHHATAGGGEITITNSNSNFGHCALLAEGFKDFAQTFDTPFTVGKIRRALDPFDKPANVKKIFLGNLVADQDNTATTLRIVIPLEQSSIDEDQPRLLTDSDYSLEEDDYLWVENVGGPDYRAQLAATPWDAANPNNLIVKTEVRTDNDDNNVNPGDPDIDANFYQALAGSRVYVRRLQDSRLIDERRTTIIISHGGGERLPLADYVIQPVANRVAYQANRISSVAASEESSELINGYRVELNYNTRPGTETDYDEATYYRRGDVVRQANKHWNAQKRIYGGAFNADDWGETFVHMEEGYAPGGNDKNAQPVIIFDGDTDQNEGSLTCGWAIDDAEVIAQYQSAVDYIGVYQWLRNEGRTDAQANTDLTLQSAANRSVNPWTGGLTVEFRRPSQCRTFGHAFEWAGFSNYTKALPQYQQTLSPNNKFTYYFTSSKGGKVYVSGFNEEGLQVTNRGLENLDTGEVLDATQIGAPDRSIDFPTIFENLTVTGSLTLTGAEVIDAPRASTTNDGVGKIASIAEVNSATRRVTDAQLNETGPRFITPESLEYWRVSRALVSQQTGITTYFIAPDDAVLGDTVSFDGVNTVLTLDPARNAQNASGNDAPTTAAKAIYFSTAAAIANNDLATTQTAIYRLGNGRYYRSLPAFGHRVSIIGAVSSFPGNNELNANYASAGQSPTTNIMNMYNNPNLIPTFGTRFFSSTSTFYSTSQIYGSPVSFTFNYASIVRGISYISCEDQINDADFPDSTFTGTLAASRAAAAGTANPLATFANHWYANNGGATTFYHYNLYPRVYAVNSDRVQLQNIISGAGLPGRGGRGSSRDGSLIDMQNSNCFLSGIYLLGNASVLQADLPSITNMAQNNVTGVQHNQALVSGYTSDAQKFGVFFPFQFGLNPTPTTNVYNYDINCIHVLDKNGNYGLPANKGNANHALRGAAFRTVIGVLAPATQFISGSYTTYRTQGVPAGRHHGWLGTFGNSVDTTGADYSPIALTFSEGIDTSRAPAYVSWMFQQAITGASLIGALPTTAANRYNDDSNADNKPGGLYWATTTGPIADNWLNCKNVRVLRGSNIDAGTRNGDSYVN